MTFPSVVAATAYSSSGNVTSWTPFTGVSVNKGSIVVVSADGGSTNLTTSSDGWARLGEVDDSGGSFLATSAVFYKTKDGSGDLVIASSASEAMTAILLRISGGGSVIGSVTVDSGDPPSLSIPGTRDALWVVALTSQSTDSATSPTDYSSKTESLGGTGKPSTYIARRTNRANSENPAGWGGDPGGSRANAAWTIALYKARRGARAGALI